MRFVMPALALGAPLVLLLAACPDTPGGVCSYEGKALAIGERVDKGDGCNECTCLSSGQVNCTEFTCTGGDGGPGGGGGGGGGGDGGAPDDAGQTDAGDPRPPSDCVDNDEDGFYTCLDENYPEWPQVVDCDDARWYVQPGGYDFPDNDLDDDCDGETDELPDCGCAADGNSVSGQDLMGAMDLCDESIVGVSTSGDAQQFGVMSSYAGSILPRDGDCLALISTGFMGATDLEGEGDGHVCGCAGSCGRDPDPNNASPEGDACDVAQLRLTLRPPSNAKGIEFSFMFLSAEWPEYLCDEYNDTFYTLYESQAVNDGARTNISFDSQQREVTVNVGFFEPPRDWTVPLGDTPFGARAVTASCNPFPSDEMCTLPGYCDSGADLGYIGSGSGWLVTRAPFEPGEETIDVVFSIHDEGDEDWDSMVILDGFRWVPYRPEVSTSKD